MKLAESLQQYVLLCEKIHHLLQEENRILQSTRKPPGAAFLARKSELLPRLDAARLAIGLGRAMEPAEVDSQTSMIKRLQKKMLTLLLLDRENEKLLLKCSMQADALRSASRPSAHLVSRAYSQAASAAA